jgi:hypothetical protein
VYTQLRNKVTNWNDVMNAIDHAWRPKQLDEEALINAFPID